MKTHFLIGLWFLSFGLVVAVGQTPYIGPDIYIGEIFGTSNYGGQGGVSAFAVGTTACNVGDTEVAWYGPTNQHPVIAHNLFRLEGMRFEQIGMSWLKHGFATLNGTYCAPCSPTAGQTLGVGCSDPYGPSTNGNRSNLGPRSEVNASIGYFPYPFGSPSYSGPLDRRLQAKDVDIDPTLHPTARYFVEAQYVTDDEISAGNHLDSIAWHEVTFSETGGVYSMTLIGVTHSGESALHAWKSVDSQVNIQTVDVPVDGRFEVAMRTTDIGGGLTHYEFAVHNMTSNRSACGFRVTLPVGSVFSNPSFHDVEHHSGDGFVIGTNYSGTDWVPYLGTDYVAWSTSNFAADPNANAVRWSTTYSFGFDLDQGPPANGLTTVIELYRGGPPSQVSTTHLPPLNVVKVSGDSQGVTYDTVSQPMKVRLQTVAGQVAGGIPVAFSVAFGNATIVGSGQAVTDSLGEATCQVIAGPQAGGPVSVVADAAGGQVTFGLHTRGLSMIYNANIPVLIANIHEVPFGSASVPFLLMAGTSQAPLVTSMGSLCLDPSNASSTFVVFDGFGVTGGGSFQGKPTVGLPSLINVYFGFVAPVGLTLDFQAIGYNPGLTALGWWATNCETVSF